MVSLGQGMEPCFGRTASCESERRIFRINPAKKRTTFFGHRGNQRDARWRWQKRDCWWIRDLENVKADSVRHQRKRQKDRDRKRSAPRRIPTKDKRFGCDLGGNAVHRGGLAASATEVMPRSRAAFATSATIS